MTFEGLRTRIARLADAADALKQRSGRESVPFSLVYFTDPARGPDPALIARAAAGRRLAIVFRAYGTPDRARRALALAATCRSRGVTLLIAQDIGLATHVGACGVHLPSWMGAPKVERPTPDFVVTAAAHSRDELVAAKAAGANAAFLSPVFHTRSHPEGGALGPERFRRLAAASGLPVFALGGVNERTALRLAGPNVVGFGAIDAFAPRQPG